eukprot:scaffold79517_cov33-Phaeocystis_antarctica.AAC.1
MSRGRGRSSHPWPLRRLGYGEQGTTPGRSHILRCALTCSDMAATMLRCQREADKEPPRGDAAAVIKLLRALGFGKFPESPHVALHGLALGKVTWFSDSSVSAPVPVEGDPPPPSQAEL